MGCHQGPIVARHGMIRALSMSLVVLLAGCGGQSNVQLNESGSATSASVPGFSRLGTLLSLVFFGAVYYESDRDMALISAFAPTGPASRTPNPIARTMSAAFGRFGADADRSIATFAPLSSRPKCRKCHGASHECARPVDRVPGRAGTGWDSWLTRVSRKDIRRHIPPPNRHPIRGAAELM